MTTEAWVFFSAVCLLNYYAGERSRLVWKSRDMYDLAHDNMFLYFVMFFCSLANFGWVFSAQERQTWKTATLMSTVALASMLAIGWCSFGWHMCWIFGAFALGFGRYYAMNWRNLRRVRGNLKEEVEP